MVTSQVEHIQFQLNQRVLEYIQQRYASRRGLSKILRRRYGRKKRLQFAVRLLDMLVQKTKAARGREEESPRLKIRRLDTLGATFSSLLFFGGPLSPSL